MKFQNAAITVNEGVGQAVVTLMRSGNVGGSTTVNYAVTDGTAATPADYGTPSPASTLTFAPKVKKLSFTVPIVDDVADELTETINMSITGTNPTGQVASPASAVLSIVDNDDPAPTGGTQTFTNSNGITINDGSAATPYPSTIAVAGLAGNITEVELTLTGLNHTYVTDLGVVLVSPANQNVAVMRCAGGDGPSGTVTLTFDDDSTNHLDPSEFIVSGTTYRPSDNNAACNRNDLPSPSPAAPHGATLSALDGQPATGTWNLYVADQSGVDVGTLAGWSLTITTA